MQLEMWGITWAWGTIESDKYSKPLSQDITNTNLSTSLFWPSYAFTVLMDDNTSSATDPAFTRPFCILATNMVVTLIVDVHNYNYTSDDVYFIQSWGIVIYS